MMVLGLGTCMNTHMVSCCFLTVTWAPVFTRILCPSGVTWKHGHTCSHKCHVPPLSCGGTGMPFYMYVVFQIHPIGAWTNLLPCMLYPGHGSAGMPNHTHAVAVSSTRGPFAHSHAVPQQHCMSSQSCKLCPSAVTCWSDHPC